MPRQGLENHKVATCVEKKNSLERAFESSFFLSFSQPHASFIFSSSRLWCGKRRVVTRKKKSPRLTLKSRLTRSHCLIFRPRKIKEVNLIFIEQFLAGNRGELVFFISLRPRFLLFYLGTFRRVVKANWFRKRREKTVLRDRILR